MKRVRRLRQLIGAVGVAGGIAAGAVAPALALDVTDYGDETKLAAAVWEQSPEVIEARAGVGTAASELRKTRTLPNPQLDFTWGTIPIGATNPHDLHHPLGNVPNYAVGISELVELGKRGPRAAAAAAQLEQARAQALATFATRFFALLGAIGDIAKSQVRAGVLGGHVRHVRRLREPAEQCRARGADAAAGLRPRRGRSAGGRDGARAGEGEPAGDRRLGGGGAHGGGATAGARGDAARAPRRGAREGARRATLDGRSSPAGGYVAARGAAGAARADALAPEPVPGRVAFDEARSQPVVAQLAGHVESVAVRLGQRVAQGDHLVAVHSPALVDVYKELAQSRAEEGAREKTVARLKSLVALKAEPEKDLVAAQQELEQTRLARAA